MTKIELTNKEVKEELLDMKRDVVADSWRDKALDVAIKAVERVHTMSEEEFEAYLKDEDLVVVKRKILKKAIKALEQTMWVPTSEKLPEDYVHVLCQFALGGMSECYLAHGMFHIVGGVRLSHDEIIAWMPILQPYRVGGEE